MVKTIIEKLNLTKYQEKAIINEPADFTLLNELPDVDRRFEKKHYDLVFTFVYTLAEMKTFLLTAVSNDYLEEQGYIFIAYPKKGNKKYPTFIHRDEILPGLEVDEAGYLPNSILKFSRMVGLDDTFTVVGIKKDSKSKNQSNNRSSGRVDDYLVKIPELEEILADHPKTLAFFNSLAAGYRKEWTRYVFSAKQQATREKRIQEMNEILSAGYKTKADYKKREL